MSAEDDGMIMPTVHVGGTSLRALMRQRQEAYEALLVAIQTTERMAPHERDYPEDYPRYQAALRLHAIRWGTLTGMRDSVLAEYQLLIEEFNSRKASGQGLLT